MQKRSLHDEMKQFRREKKRLVPAIISLGVVGLILPIIPGVALLCLGGLLLFPGEVQGMAVRMREKFSSHLGTMEK